MAGVTSAGRVVRLAGAPWRGYKPSDATVQHAATVAARRLTTTRQLVKLRGVSNPPPEGDTMSQLTRKELAAIVETRALLRVAAARADHMGRFAEVLVGADAALFRVLNVAHAYYDEDLSYEQLYGYPDPALVGDKWVDGEESA